MSWVTSKLDAQIVKSILDEITIGMTNRADAQDPAVAKADEDIHKPIQETAVLDRAAQTHVDLHVTDWWPPNRKIQYLKPWSSGFLTRKYRI